MWKREGWAIGTHYSGADIGSVLEVFVFVVLIVVDRRMRRNIITETPGTITANYLYIVQTESRSEFDKRDFITGFEGVEDGCEGRKG